MEGVKEFTGVSAEIVTVSEVKFTTVVNLPDATLCRVPNTDAATSRIASNAFREGLGELSAVMGVVSKGRGSA